MLEKCRYCGFEHEDFKHIFFRRNHVSNRVLSHCLHCLRRLYQVPYRPELNIKKEGNIMALHYKEELKNLVILTQTILAKNACEILKRKDISSTIHSLILDEKIKSKIVDVKCRDGKIRPMKILYSMDATDEVVFKFEKSLQGEITSEKLLVHKKKKYSKVKNKQPDKLEALSNAPEYTIINGIGGILIKIHKRNSVVNKNDIADLHEKLPFIIDDLISGNIHKFAKDIDYFVDNEELLFTETGYLMLVESFKDKLSQKVRNQMMIEYFKYQNINVNSDTNYNENPNDESSNQLYTNDNSGYMKILHDQIKILSEKIGTLERKLSDLGSFSPVMN